MAGIWKCRCASRGLACACAKFRWTIAGALAESPRSRARCRVRLEPAQRFFRPSPVWCWSGNADCSFVATGLDPVAYTEFRQGSAEIKALSTRQNVLVGIEPERPHPRTDDEETRRDDER